MVLERIKRSKVAEQDDGTSAKPRVPHEFLESLGVAVYTTDAGGIILSFNEAAVQLWGRRPEVGKDMWCGSWRLYYPDGLSMAHEDCPMGVCLRENRSVRGGLAIAERPDGTRVWFVPYPTPLRDSEGNLIGAVNVLVDVTQQKLAERAVAESEDDLRDFFENSAVALHWAGPDGTILRANAAELQMLGYQEDEYLGRHIAEFHADAEAIEDILARLTRGEVLRDYEARLRCKDGSIKVVLIDSSVRWRDGAFIHTRCFTRDITDRKEAEQRIQEALAVKDEFVGLVSHELRTPLTTILGNAAILARRESALDEQTRQAAAEDVYGGAVRLNGIIEDLLALARLERGKVEREPVLLGRLVQRLVRENREEADRRVEVRIEGEQPVVLGDENLVARVFDNYLSNAVKYSPVESTIEVVIDEADGQGRVRVLDRGIGVDPAEAGLVFDSFYRSKNVAAIGGLGIGLSVCRRLIQAVGGECWARPRPGGGSEFGFAMPVDDS